jgi:hypothetical protein
MYDEEKTKPDTVAEEKKKKKKKKKKGKIDRHTN